MCLIPNRELIFTTVPRALLYLQSLSQENSLVQVVCRLFFFLSLFLFFFPSPLSPSPDLHPGSVNKPTNPWSSAYMQNSDERKQMWKKRNNCTDQHQHYYFPSGFISVFRKILCMHIFSNNVVRCSFDTFTSLQTQANTYLISVALTLLKRWHPMIGLFQEQIFKIPVVSY